MSACEHHLCDGPLVCLLEQHPDHPNGHRYEAGSGIPRCAKEE